ncbi:MAG: FAD-dependent oxidoreductase, partial [Thermoplasmata archaeon]|nr:FAD-dependent oxidoreductase [Thermoplasmata archaeon]
MAEIIVLGGGVAGLVAAKMLSPFHKVTLFEEADSLGGVGGTLSCKAGADCTVCTACTLPELTEQVLADPNVTVKTGIDLSMELPTGDAIILATGLDVADGKKVTEYGADRYDRVITALELDRLLRQEGESARGGRVLDLPGEDGRVAIVQCVCSRDTGQLPYCSRVCCAYSARLAIEVRERYPGVNVDVFYMDIQREDAVASAQIDEAMANKGIEYIRSRPAAVQEVPGGRMEVLYEDTLQGGIFARDYDLVILSTGLVPSKGTMVWADKLGVRTDEHGFISIHPETATRTSDSTVFAAGGSTGPVDLVEASMGAMAAAAEVLETLPPEWPGHPPRIIVIGGGPAAEGADLVMRAAGAVVSMVLGAPGKGLQRLEGEPLGFQARMGSPGSDAIFKLKGDIVIIVPDRGGAFYEPVPEEAGT